jgi:predicted HicB family RNase H-like nuclease
MPAQPKPKKPGRPKLPRGAAKGKTVQVRFNTDDLKRVTAAAKVSKQSLSEWIRSTVNAAVGSQSTFQTKVL